MVVTASKGCQGEPLRRFAVGFRLQRRDPLSLHLVLEAVDEVLFGEAAGGLDLIAQQVAHGVVVLAVRQATHGQRLQAALLGQRDLLARLAHLFVRKAGQVVDPAQQRLFFVTARLDPLAAGVFRAVRGLPQQQRSLGIPPIDQIDQLESERRDLGLAGVGRREIRVVSPRPRRCRCGTVRTARRAAPGAAVPRRTTHRLHDRLRRGDRWGYGRCGGDQEGGKHHPPQPSSSHRLPPDFAGDQTEIEPGRQAFACCPGNSYSAGRGTRRRRSRNPIVSFPHGSRQSFWRRLSSASTSRIGRSSPDPVHRGKRRKERVPIL